VIDYTRDDWLSEGFDWDTLSSGGGRGTVCPASGEDDLSLQELGTGGVAARSNRSQRTLAAAVFCGSRVGIFGIAAIRRCVYSC